MPMTSPVPLDRQKIRELREALGLSVAEAARRAGMSRQRWHTVESGVSDDPTFGTVEAIAKVLGVSLDELVAGAGK